VSRALRPISTSLTPGGFSSFCGPSVFLLLFVLAQCCVECGVVFPEAFGNTFQLQRAPRGAENITVDGGPGAVVRSL